MECGDSSSLFYVTLIDRSRTVPKRRQVVALQNSFVVFQNLHRAIPAGCPHNAAARMRCRTAHVEIANRRAILHPTRRRPQKEKLLERQLALKDIAFRKSKVAFDVERRQHLAMQN